MFTIQTKTANLIDDAGTFDIPEYIARDSKLLSVICDMDEDADVVDTPTETVPIMVNQSYFEKLLEYYQHYESYFKDEVQASDADFILPLPHSIVFEYANDDDIAQHEENFKRREDIPTEALYIDKFTKFKEITESVDAKRDEEAKQSEKEKIELAPFWKRSKSEIANQKTMNDQKQFQKYWMNDFERRFVSQFHWISPMSPEYPKETDGVLRVTETQNDPNSGAAISVEAPKLSIFRMYEYCGYSGYMGFNSLGRFLSKYMNSVVSSHSASELCKLTKVPCDPEKVDKEAKEFEEEHDAEIDKMIRNPTKFEQIRKYFYN